MRTAIMLSRALRLLLMFLAIVLARAAQLNTVEDAYRHLTSNEALYPRDVSKTDAEALRILRDNREQSKAMFLSILSKGGPRHEFSERLCIATFERAELMAIVRTVVDTYDRGDPSIPFVGFLTINGEKQDMEVLKDLIRRSPDSAGAVAQATLMAESANALAHEALRELMREARGKWQESVNVRNLLSGKAPPASVGAKAVVNDRSRSKPAGQEGAPQLPDQMGAAESLDDEPRNQKIWFLGGIAAVLLIALIVFGRRFF